MTLALPYLYLALAIVFVSGAGIAVLSYFAIHEASEADKSRTTTLVFTSVLPLLGTWVGAVLAYAVRRV